MRRTIAALAVAALLPAAASAKLPAFATFNGSVGEHTLALTLDRRAWTIAGSMDGKPAKVLIDNDARTVKGGAVDLTFDWTPERVTFDGTSRYTVDWQAGTLIGTVNGQAEKLTFSLQDGTVNGDDTGLTLDKPTGRLTGTLNGKSVALTIVNADLSEFLQNLYLFARP